MRVKARHPVTGHYEYGYLLDRSDVRWDGRPGSVRWLIRFDDGGKGWVHPKFVYSKSEYAAATDGDVEQEQEKLL